MDKVVWKSPNDEAMVTDYTCPACNKGLLKLFKEDLVLREYVRSKANHKHEDMQSDWVESSCSGVLQCNHDYCLEYVSFCGEARGDDIEYISDEVPGGWGLEYIDKIEIKYIYPSPNLIPLSAKYPESIIQLLKDSFCLYWSSPASCANKMRIIVEEVLNDQKVPLRHKVTKGNGTIKFCKSNTHQRILRLGKKKGFSESAEYLLAIKEIGNSASHASEFNDKAIIPAYKLLDKALNMIYIGYDKELEMLKDLAKSKKLA